jgi:hypothetical protein
LPTFDKPAYQLRTSNIKRVKLGLLTRLALPFRAKKVALIKSTPKGKGKKSGERVGVSLQGFK